MDQLVSIIIPNFNREHLISDTLESIIKQTYTKWECIVIDDHSTDNSWEIVNGFCNRDKRIKQIKRPSHLSKGACSCRNYGFEVSNGEYINWFDSDDLMLPEKLNKQMTIATNEKSDLVICQTRFFEKNVNNLKNYWNKIFTPKFDPLTDFITFRLAWSTNDPLWRKSFLENKELWNSTLTSSQDWEFHARILVFNPTVSIIKEILVLARIHPSRIGVSNKTTRPKVRLISRVDIFNKLKDQKLLNKELRRYFKSFFMNQLRILYDDIPYLKNTIYPILIECIGKWKWFFIIKPKVQLYLVVNKLFGKRHLTFKYLIKQVVNENRK